MMTAEFDKDDEAKELEAIAEEIDGEVEVIDPESTVDLEGALAEAQRQADENWDRYLRLRAEWDNYRTRTESERAAERTRATERLVTNLLPVLDDLERALDHANLTDAAPEFSSFVEGVAGVQKKLLDILGRERLESVGEVGEPFDPIKHQAITKVDDQTVPDETVVQVYQKGYAMAGKSLRSAMVVVSSGGPARVADEPEEDEEEPAKD